MPMDAALRKYDFWSTKPRIEHNFLAQLQKLVNALYSIIKDEKDPLQMVRNLRSFTSLYRVNDFADQVAKNMVTMLLHDGAHTWREAARESSKGRLIYEALRHELNGSVGGVFNFQILRNAELIKTLPLDIAGHVTEYVARESLAGRRAEDIAGDIVKMFPANSRAKARLIARTEVSKVGAALTQVRAEDMGINAYIWRTSEDERVREGHKKMDDVIVFWNEPPRPETLMKKLPKTIPAPYHAGNIWNCRCYAEPIIDINRIVFPHKVWHNNRVKMMTKSEFLRLAA